MKKAARIFEFFGLLFLGILVCLLGEREEKMKQCVLAQIELSKKEQINGVSWEQKTAWRKCKRCSAREKCAMVQMEMPEELFYIL